jgi:hypothetical protein
MMARLENMLRALRPQLEALDCKGMLRAAEKRIEPESHLVEHPDRDARRETAETGHRDCDEQGGKVEKG